MPKTAKPSPIAPLSFAKRDPQAQAKAERIPLFELDGTEYTMPAVVPYGDRLRFGLVTRGLDGAARTVFLLRELAGPDAVAALLEESEVTPEDWRKLSAIVTEHCSVGIE